MRIVIPGNYRQFTEWLHMVYGAGGGQGDPPARPILREEQLYGLTAESVEVLHLIGTYWENPVWGSESYRLLMEEGMLLRKFWAMEWAFDWQKANMLRAPIEPGELEAARDGLIRIARELTDDA